MKKTSAEIDKRNTGLQRQWNMVAIDYLHHDIHPAFLTSMQTRAKRLDSAGETLAPQKV